MCDVPCSKGKLCLPENRDNCEVVGAVRVLGRGCYVLMDWMCWAGMEWNE